MEWAANITTANWVGLIQVTLFVFIILLGFPMAFTLLAMSVIFGYYAFFDAKLFAEVGVFGNRIFDLIVKNAFSTMENHVLIAIPLFLFMGYIVEKAGIVARLFNAIRVATYKLPGSLAVASLITCAIFSTATGIVGAVVTLMGLLAWPAMVNNVVTIKRACNRNDLRRWNTWNFNSTKYHNDHLWNFNRYFNWKTIYSRNYSRNNAWLVFI